MQVLRLLLLELRLFYQERHLVEATDISRIPIVWRDLLAGGMSSRSRRVSCLLVCLMVDCMFYERTLESYSLSFWGMILWGIP